MTIHLPRLVRRTDPRTSVEAADSITEETIADSKDEVLYLLAPYGPMADHELIAKHEHEVRLHPEYRRYSAARLRTARAELTRDEPGRPRKVEARVGWTKTPSGRKAIIWALTEESA